MLDELTIYNLAIKYPNTVDLVREVERQTIDEFAKQILSEFCLYCDQDSCDGGMIGSIQECETVRTLRNVVEGIAEEMKG